MKTIKIDDVPIEDIPKTVFRDGKIFIRNEDGEEVEVDFE